MILRDGLPCGDDHFAVFSTGSVPPAFRTECWAGIIARYFGPFETRAIGDMPFEAALATRTVSFLRVFRIVGSGHRVRRSAGGHVPDAVKLLLQVRSHCRLDQEGRTAELAPGSWCLYDPLLPYELTSFGDTEQIVVQIPRQKIFDRQFPRLGAPFVADRNRSGVGRIAASFIASYVDPAAGPCEADGFLAETTVGLVRCVLQADATQRHGVQAQPCLLRTRIKQYILTHLRDPDLSIDQIADAMGCSKRYLHQVFAAEHLTIERHIWRLRIERCREALGDRGQAHRSISEIAFETGFNSSAHFSRLFKSQFGVPPATFRQSRIAAAMAGCNQEFANQLPDTSENRGPNLHPNVPVH